jgi:hypothetical protein
VDDAPDAPTEAGMLCEQDGHDAGCRAEADEFATKTPRHEEAAEAAMTVLVVKAQHASPQQQSM